MTTDLTEAYKSKEREVKDLVAKKDSIEKEINDNTDYLTVGPGSRFGMTGSLVDKDGFPDKDVELILAVRQARNNLARLKNDHKEIMNTIQEELYNLHGLAAKLKHSGGAVGDNNKKVVVAEQMPANPFVLVDQVSNNSPASEAGLQVGDSIVSFGTVGPFSSSDSTALASVARVVKDSENNSVSVVVLREGKQVTLHIVPKRWAGNGLLGYVA